VPDGVFFDLVCMPCQPDGRSVEADPIDVTGTIRRIVRDKGFGFITPDDGSEDVFFHRSRLGPQAQFEELREGDAVEFQTRPGEKGPQAFNVKLR
jgi:CspA family cold shock protein